MKTLRHATLLTFLVGLALLSVGLIAACGSNGDDDADEFGNETPTNTPEATATPEPTATVPPSPTATPYDGEVAAFRIPRFEVESEIENVGLTPNNQLDVPADPLNTAWYGIYDRPGWGGNSVFSAHVDYFPNIRGPFYDLARVEEGDLFVVVMADGTEYTYEAIRYQRYHVDTIPMGDLIWPEDKPEGEEWITLITCGGEFRQTSASGAGEYLHRDVVVARRIDSPAQSEASSSR